VDFSEMMIDPVDAFLEDFFLLTLLAVGRQKENQAAYKKGCAANH